ncbi:hypothetical protein FGW37_13630 [Streptomyces rectiverticillatus]|uniref:DUF6415 family natural product biosynthesis protein n=1 Tax=Streptomyces rectiverticillatus TaxID=173860 RepID=UPI0015C38305|nr:DUF6415 family natural product biosynthesis protein [Streptomyces rectiverticillatus]QLE72498.1 hypothetical protein FGW37_13630 [Streptomyces rectiverticillatus]
MPLCPYTGHTGGGLTYVPPPTAAAGAGPDVVDAVIRDAIAMDRWLPAPSRVAELTERLRAYIGAAVPVVEGAVQGRPVDDSVRVEVLATAAEARHRLGLGPGNGYASAITYARSLGLVARDLLRLQQGLR